MKRMMTVALAAAGVLAAVGAAWAEDTKFRRKAGVPVAAEKRDSAQCWKIAQKTRMTDEQATGNLLTGYLLGGVIGVASASVNNEDANKSPKSQFRRQVHDDCMVKRGYRVID